MSSATLLAVPLTRTPPPLADQVQAALAAGADLVELRVDRLGDPDPVARLLEQPAPCPYVLTIRSAAEGGAWQAGEAERLSLYLRLGRLGPGYLDLEYASWAHSEDIRQRIGGLCCGAGGGSSPDGGGTPSGGSQLILSHHDFRGTPADLDAVVRPLFDAEPAVVKAVFMAHDAIDAWRVLDLLRRRGPGRRLIALAMGEAGLLTRVLAPKFSGFLVFATLDAAGATAPGQPTVRELLEVYRWREVGPATRVFGVVGWPVTHSRSPHVHNAAMSAAGIDGVLVPMPVAPDYADFAAFMDWLTARPEFDVAGLCVTIPHKVHALRWLTDHGFAVEPLARRAGAVNTLTRAEDGWRGDNTDVAGVLAALQTAAGALGTPDARPDVAVLGAGGAARATVVALQSLGCRVTVYNRMSRRAAGLAAELGCAWAPWEDRARARAPIVINATSVGMQPHVDAVPVDPAALDPGTVVFDLVYTPAETRLLREACRHGCRIVSGVEMFIAQAAAQFELWHNRPAPRDILRAVLAG